jgi:hypothetical protein
LRDLLCRARDKNHQLSVAGIQLHKAEGVQQVHEGTETTARSTHPSAWLRGRETFTH